MTGTLRVWFGGPFQLDRANERVLASRMGLIGPVTTTFDAFPDASVVMRTEPEPWIRETSAAVG